MSAEQRSATDDADSGASPHRDPPPVQHYGKKLLTIEDLAVILTRSVDGVRKMRALGHLPPATRIGNRLYWIEEKFMKWVEENEEPDDYVY